MSFFRLGLTAVLVPLFLAPAFAATDPLYQSMRDAALADSFVVENIEIHRDGGVITLKTGSIGFTAPAMGLDTVAVFDGEGTFTFNPASPIDRNYMASLTGQLTVSETFDRAFFCFTDDTGKEIRSAAKTHSKDPKLADILRDYRKHLRSRLDMPRSMLEYLLNDVAMDNLEADVAMDLYNRHAPGFFRAYIHGKRHADLRFQVRPRGAFPELGTPEEVALINLDPEAKEEGIWYLSHLQGEIKGHTASSDENRDMVQADHYQIETTIARNDHFTASADLKFHAVTEGDRVIKFSLVPTLRVEKVTSGGQDVPFIQEDKKEDASFYVVMAEPMAKGSEHELHIEYTGDKVVHKEGGGNFSVGARESWYPNVNTFRDHASYDLTFKVPKPYTLVSVGNLEKQWTEKDAACTHWVSETPIPIAGFNYGAFKVKKITDKDSGFVVEGYANTEPPDALAMAKDAPGVGSLSPSNMMDMPMGEAQVAERIYDAWFGKSEFNHVSVTQQPEFNFGQSWPTLVYLPLWAYLDPTQRYMLLNHIEQGLTDFVDEVTPHEVSHQWWGHMVGWATYHDQWLSEGFATFSAGLFLQLTEKTPEKYQKYWQNARQYLLEKNNFGNRRNDAGPVWLGQRMDSAHNQSAYDAVVYRKGAYVLHMLRMMMWDQKEGDKPFIEMMHDFVSTFMNKNASTESFERIVEKHMTPSMKFTTSGRMDWFFYEWLYDTPVPRYKLDFTLTDQEGGKCLLKASVEQSEVPKNFIMPVPIYADFDGHVMRLASVPIQGTSTSREVQLMLPKRPKKVMLNYWHDVLEAL
ncbi:MAG TPA: M1 family aminopeptidase [Bryobacteraceae bacterium]|nr:M1 family aminopeptidase [Bryobacteraceae bacterium]